jgi:phage gp46-like protein
MSDRFSGDPKIFLTEQGADLHFYGGQPVLDGGLENAATISLFSDDWFANILFDDKNQHVGSLFETACSRAITRSSIIDMNSAGKSDLSWMVNTGVASKTEVLVSNPASYRVNAIVKIYPPGSDLAEIIITRHGANWINQSTDPAYMRA